MHQADVKSKEGLTRMRAAAPPAGRARGASPERGGGGSGCACGGGCPRCAAIVPVQTAAGAPQDRLEHEADRMAEQAMNAAPAAACEGSIKSMGTNADSSVLPAAFAGTLSGGGQALPGHARRFFEPRFGRDLSDVRIHTDARAARAARTLHARAFTRGRDVYFGAGEFRPHESAGQKLLAHEIAHTLQQTGGGAPGGPIMRKPLPGEDQAAYTRRQNVIRDARVAVQNLERCLARKTACWRETLSASGEIHIEIFGKQIVESKGARNARLSQLAADLKDLANMLEAGAVPPGWSDDVHYEAGKQQAIFSSGYDIDPVYVHYAIKHGRDAATAITNTFYIDSIIEKKPKPKSRPSKPKETPPPPVSGGGMTHAAPNEPEDIAPSHFEERLHEYIVVPDPQNAPRVYHKLSRYGDNRGFVPEVFRDEGGYFYRRDDGSKVYIPDYVRGWIP